MMIIFQISAAVVILIAGYFMLRGGGARHQAMQRILMLLFMVAAVSSVFLPGLWTYAANLVGVGRGADLLLYITVLVFLGFVATSYRRFRRTEKDITELARKVALLSAQSPDAVHETTAADDGR
ncbi:DUF2304 domain-containing protein [Salinibacterium sp. PAMC 21357]|uniref:DUF2304 domain-containing protein n=1 Tax=Salinibacterium sp. PAMC 21357 TaxID=1112215 RepID=UPI000287F187|nr:DUF2304 domain-containing protein [Salinibacterium sp. PAMC 21357]